MKNYYEILEVNEKASNEVIEKAYKVLAKKNHPDLYKGDKQKNAEKMMKDINEAYNVLSDAFLREQYDNELQKEKLKEKEYHDAYAKTKMINNFIEENREKEEEEFNKKMQKHKVGSFSGIIELLKELYSNKPKRQELKDITKKDFVALILTIVVIILIGIILWNIPFTNGWMRELLFENPISAWIGGLFSKN